MLEQLLVSNRTLWLLLLKFNVICKIAIKSCEISDILKISEILEIYKILETYAILETSEILEISRDF